MATAEPIVETETYNNNGSAEPIKQQQSMPSQTSNNGHNVNDESNEELNGLYEQARSDIDKLRLRIQQLRKQKPKKLRSEFAIRKKQEEAKEAQRKSRPQPPQNEEAKNDEPKEPELLSKLTLKLKEYRTLSGHGNKVYGCDWNPHNDNRLVSVGRDGKLLFWYADTGYKRLAYPLETEFIMTLKYSPDGRHVACGGLDDVLSIFEVKSETGIIDCEPKIYKAHTGYISCLQYIDNNTILTSSGDKTIREWDLSKDVQTPSYTYCVHREDVMSMDLNPKNPNLLLTGSVDSTTKIIDLRIKPQQEDENKSDYTPNNGNISTSYNNNVTHSFYMGYDDLSKRNRTTDVNVVKWFPNGDAFVAGCDDGTVRLFDYRSGRVLSEYSYHRQTNDDINGYKNGRNSNDNTSLVKTSTNTPDGTDHEHKNNDDEVDHKAHEPLKASDDDPDYFEDELEGTDGVAALDFSKSGAFMFVSYNNDQHEVLVWNILENRVVQKLKHQQHVPCLKVSPDGKTLVTACWNHHLKLWK
mmetsp:Transcript_70364/g.63156  ORF Transcript_70364/g.63156 Transcript_70364/m.63156 type:complete len:525 (-) Transcript_70364:756-2330(-)